MGLAAFADQKTRKIAIVAGGIGSLGTSAALRPKAGSIRPLADLRSRTLKSEGRESGRRDRGRWMFGSNLACQTKDRRELHPQGTVDRFATLSDFCPKPARTHRPMGPRANRLRHPLALVRPDVWTGTSLSSPGAATLEMPCSLFRWVPCILSPDIELACRDYRFPGSQCRAWHRSSADSSACTIFASRVFLARIHSNRLP